ncbi:MAG: baseplate J/gp47 family protein [Lachnospiraceae bacterium]|nr:baseplate J/gp47 family protein [Lachnospiraceae bacterium]
MLKRKEPTFRGYEERMQETLSLIPLYSDEWTNYNVSDPGITMLESLTLFSALQAQSVSEVSYEARRKLLTFTGITPGKGKCARVLMKAIGAKEGDVVPQNARFTLGGLTFETNRATDIGAGNPVAFYGYYGGEYHDYSFLLDRDVPVEAPVFGHTPGPDDAVYLIADRLPEAGKEMLFFIQIAERAKRNPIENRAENIFAEMVWECYTEQGFVEMKTRDFTGCFLFSGELRLRMPDEKAVAFPDTPVQGYCIRGRLKRASYDIEPRVEAVDSFLFEVWQKDTRAASMIFNNTQRVRVRHPLAAQEHILVFGKEEKGSSYRRYELSYTAEEEGRCCKYLRGEDGSFLLEFKEGETEPHPVPHLKEPVRVVLYNEEIMNRYAIGQVLGYDMQELELPCNHLVQDSFSLIARRRDDEGYLYDFVRPGKREDDALTYHLLENDGKIVIEEAGDFIGADLFVASLAVTRGDVGNVRVMSSFRTKDAPKHVSFFNPGEGTGGAFRETVEQMSVRLRADIDTPYTAVTAEDYERIVLETPGLCIRKAHAVMDEKENLVRIAVMPDTTEPFPALSEIYRSEIAKRLEERRLLTVRFEILPPQYVRVHVRGTVYVNRNYADPETAIREAVKRQLDINRAGNDFGKVLHFRDLFAAIDILDCVEFISDLSLLPESRRLAEVRDTDIVPRADTICTAGEIAIEVVAHEA